MSHVVLTFCFALIAFSCRSEIYPKIYFGKILRNEKHHTKVLLMVTGDFVHILTEKAEGQTGWLRLWENGLQVMDVEFFISIAFLINKKMKLGLWGDLSRLFFTNPDLCATLQEWYINWYYRIFFCGKSFFTRLYFGCFIEDDWAQN